VGNDQSHLLCSFKQEGSNKVFDCIGFNMGEYYDILINSPEELNIVYTIDKTVRDDRIYPQFRLKDIKTKEMLEEKI
jgi:single-stranded-DNA-specific exonuclease